MVESSPLAPFHHTELLETFGKEALIAGVDEVGRGALFGPVVAAAVILPESILSELPQLGIKDSKQLTVKRRGEFALYLQGVAMSWGVGYAKAEEIDSLNIHQATLLAMERAVKKLHPLPNVCLVDGRFPIPKLSIPQYPLIKGDARSPLIAAASILAKVWRDDLIIRLAQKYPEYDLVANKGYGTKRHQLALQQYGASEQHRRSFKPCQQ